MPQPGGAPLALRGEAQRAAALLGRGGPHAGAQRGTAGKTMEKPWNMLKKNWKTHVKPIDDDDDFVRMDRFFV